jgi:hypothetical protein
MKKRHLDGLVKGFLGVSAALILVRIFLVRPDPFQGDGQLLVITRVSLILVSALLVIMSRFLIFMSGLMSFPPVLRSILAVFLLVLGVLIQAIGFVFSLWAGDWLEHLPFAAIGVYQILRFRGPVLRMIAPDPAPNG